MNKSEVIVGLPPPPPSVTLLLDYLKQTPHPTEVNIAILDVDDDDSTYPARAYAKVETYLGIHAPDLPQLAREFREEYSLLRRRYRQSNAVGCNGELTSRILDTISCLLLVCPDHSTAWADRRRALLGDDASVIDECFLQKELDFCNLLFTQHSKAPSSWAHRKYVGKKLVDLILEATDDSHDTANKLYKWAISEIDTCSTIAEKYPKNYHAWTQRVWTCRLLFGLWRGANSNIWEGCSLYPLTMVVFTILEKEFSTVGKWMKTHVTDHSAVHYQGQILHMLLEIVTHPDSEYLIAKEVQRLEKNGTNDESGPASIWAWDLLSKSMEISRSSRFPSYEVTWIHRRICGLASVKYLSKAKVSNESHPKLLDEFINVEIKDLLAKYSTKSKCHKTRVYALSYTVWIMKHLRDSPLLDECDLNDLNIISKEVVDALARDDLLVANIWRIVNAQHR